MDIDRRLILGGGVAAAAAIAGVPGVASPALARPVSGDPAGVLPATPEAGLTDFMRMFAGLSGSTVFANEGLIYGKLDGELPKPLFGFVSVIEMRAKEVEPGLWRSEQKEAMACLDIVTRMPIRTIRNPYTNEDNYALGYVSPVNVYYFDKHGSGFRDKPKPAQTSRIWRSSGTDVWVTESRYNYFPASITEAEFPRSWAGPTRHSVDILTYRAHATDFTDRRLDNVPGTLTMVSDTPWPLWMMMGKRGGSAIYQGSGQKYRRFRDLPAITRRAIDQGYPGFLDDPWNFPSESYGTATQMRRLRAEGKM